MNDTAYWIWLLRTLGPAAPIRDILAYFGSPQSLYEAGSMEWRLSGIMTAKQVQALTKFSPSESGAVMKTCQENGWEIVTPSHICYPQSLLELSNFPPVLFVWGDAETLTQPVKLSMVGTRKATRYGARVAFLLAEALSQSGAIVVSGGALGVDSASHEGALSAGGKTIAVLGCGLGTDYLKENAPLRARIAKNGAVISEFLPFSPASRTTFPLRNRIIAGLSLGTVVVEAGERSGSLITARCALEQGRDVFAVPGDLITTAYTGGNKLIRDGAKPVFAPIDVLEEYLYLYPEELKPKAAEKTFRALLLEHQGREEMVSPPPETKPPKAPQKRKPKQKPQTAEPKQQEKATSFAQPPSGISPTAEQVFLALANGEKHIDDLCELLHLPVHQVLPALTELELFGCVQLSEGKKYKRL